MFEQPPAYDSQRDILYLVDNAGRLMGVDAESATILWATSGSPAYANATYADGQLFLTTAKSPIRLVSLDPDSQAVNWQLDLTATSQAVLPAYDAGVLYLSQVNGWVTAVDTVG
jgi:outer membrane protein assembly factor BamB